MEKKFNQYQFVFFANDILIEPSVTNVAATMTAFQNINLIPGYGQEFNPLKGDKRTFLRMVSPDEKIQINFQSESVVLIVQGDIDYAMNMASIIYSGLSTLDFINQRKAYRLSFVSESVYSGDDDEYNEVYKKIVGLKTDDIPFEWDVRLAFREDINIYHAERINLIAMLRRLDVRSAEAPHGVDSFSLIYDSNTHQENTTPRYSFLQAIDVYQELLKKSNSRFKYVEELI